MKRKQFLAASVSVVTASAMVLSPVPFQMASAITMDYDVSETFQLLSDIFGKLDAVGNEELKLAYEAMLPVVKNDIAALQFGDLANLEAKLGSNAGEVGAAITAFALQLVEFNGNHAQGFETSLSDLNTALKNAQLINEGSELVMADLELLLKAMIDALLRELVLNENQLVTQGLNVFDGKILAVLVDGFTTHVVESWNVADEKIVQVIANAYSDVSAFTSDMATLKAALTVSDPAKKTIYKEGAFALALAYTQLALKPLNSNYSGQNVVLNPSLLGLESFLMPRLEWIVSSNNPNVTLDQSNGLVLRINNTFGEVDVQVTAKLKGGNFIPTKFVGVELFSQNIKVTIPNPAPAPQPDPSSTSGPTDASNPVIQLSAGYEQQTDIFLTNLTTYLQENPVPKNNSEQRTLTETIRRDISSILSFKVDTILPAASPIIDFSVLNTNLLMDQINAVTKHLNEFNVVPVHVPLTLVSEMYDNFSVNLDNSNIELLKAASIGSLVIQSALGASLETPLNLLEGGATIAVNSTPASGIENAQSDVYSFDVTDANGATIPLALEQYRVTLPVTGDGNNLTIAKVEGNQQTIMSGKYDENDATVTFYTNTPGDYIVVENNVRFNDTASISWADGAIATLATAGIIQGRGDGHFDPHGNVTRAEFTAMITRALNLQMQAPVLFNDVPENAWYYDAVSAAKVYGITTGRSASTFAPNAQITRDEMVTMAANALRSVMEYTPPQNIDTILDQFVDQNTIAPFAIQSVALLTNEGIVQGRGVNNFDPKGTASRAEVAVIIADIFERR